MARTSDRTFAVMRATSALLLESVTRDAGGYPDARFDVPLAMLEDLTEELDAAAVEELAGRLREGLA